MLVLSDTARFTPTDEPAVVAASFACPCCIESPTDVVLELAEAADGGDALCACQRCSILWRVALDADQSLRMAIAPPPTLELRPTC